MNKPGKVILLGLLATVAGIQFIPVRRDNPEVSDDLKAPAEIDAVLRRSCYDCHSNETRWPWYAYVAPVSWWVAKDVRKGREALDFSNWKQGEQKYDALLDEIKDGLMPMPAYLFTHPEARISRDNLCLLDGWIRAGAPRGDGAVFEREKKP
jgi:hypothetical protein